jgi:hypothetical protein
LKILHRLSNVAIAALSYVWGDLLITENIELDGVTLPVTSSPAAAFRHVQNHWDSVLKEEYPGRDSSHLDFGKMQPVSFRIAREEIPRWGALIYRYYPAPYPL